MDGDNRLVNMVNQLTRALANAPDVDASLRNTLEVAIETVDADGGSILLHDPEHKELMFRHAVSGPSGPQRPTLGFGLIGSAIADDEGIAGKVFQTRTPQIDSNVKENPQHSGRIDAEFQYETRNLATIPLGFPDGEVVGVMQFVNKRSGDFTEEDLTALSILSAIAALNVVLRSKLSEARPPEEEEEAPSGWVK